jgi:hypothetical protein
MDLEELPNQSPFEKDVIDGPVRPLSSSSQPPLSEKDFIQNQNPIAPLPFWVWLFLATILVALIWGTWGWYEQNVKKVEKNEPFLQVTNREFSSFLWKFPNYLRSNVAQKTGYLPEFQPDRAIFALSAADNYVTAPPDLLFLYHTWNRLLTPEFIRRLITPVEFSEFLDQVVEWQPANWSQAPEAYKQLINQNTYKQLSNLQILPEATLPLMVRQSFQGWKNYFKEGEQINALSVTFAQVQEFLKNYPAYERPNWRNISQVADQPVAGENYLLSLHNGVLDVDQVIPNNQLSMFLKVALFNEQQAKQEK